MLDVVYRLTQVADIVYCHTKGGVPYLFSAWSCVSTTFCRLLYFVCFVHSPSLPDPFLSTIFPLGRLFPSTNCPSCMQYLMGVLNYSSIISSLYITKNSTVSLYFDVWMSVLFVKRNCSHIQPMVVSSSFCWATFLLQEVSTSTVRIYSSIYSHIGGPMLHNNSEWCFLCLNTSAS